jgi:hypothetical protein
MLARARDALAERLVARRAELEQLILTRVFAVSEPAPPVDPVYVQGLRAAVGGALDYALGALGEEEPYAPPPQAVLAQARLAARYGVGVDTVLRRYVAGYTLLSDFLIQEAEASAIRGPVLQAVMRTPATLFERLIGIVTEEHAREADSRRSTTEERRTARIRSLLEGELLETSDLDYDFDVQHLGAIATGDDAERAIRCLARNLDRRLLLVQPDPGEVWGWLGGRQGLTGREVQVALGRLGPSDGTFVLGEPSDGIGGWRLTHRQAKAALPIAMRRGGTVRYADVALLASLLQDDLLATSLREIYLKPFEQDRDGGETSRQTLRAYFTAGRNVSSAAAALGVSRRAVANRLRSIEAKLPCPLDAAIAEVEAALLLEDTAAPRRVPD